MPQTQSASPACFQLDGTSPSRRIRLWLLLSGAVFVGLGAPSMLRAQEVAPIVLDTVTLTNTAGETSSGGVTADGYVAKATTTGTKTETPLIKVPQSVSVVTRRQLDDRNVQTLNQALTYTPGVRIGSSGFDPRFDAFTIRGFDVTYTGIIATG